MMTGEAAGVVRIAVLNLQGGVADPKAGFQFLADVMKESVRMLDRSADEVSGQSHFRGAHGPDVQVVDLADTGLGAEELLDSVAIQLLRDSLQSQIEGFAKQTPGAVKDDGGDDEADSGIDPEFARPEDGQACQDDPKRNSGVPSQVEKSASYVEIGLAAAEKQEGAKAVDDYSELGDGTDCLALDRGGMLQPQDRIPSDRAHGDEENDSVGQGSEDRGAAETISVFTSGPGLDQAAGPPGQNQAEHIREIMSGIRDQSEGVGGQSEDELDHNEGAVERDADGEGVVEIGRVRERIMAVAMAGVVVVMIVGMMLMFMSVLMSVSAGSMAVVMIRMGVVSMVVAHITLVLDKDNEEAENTKQGAQNAALIFLDEFQFDPLEADQAQPGE